MTADDEYSVDYDARPNSAVLRGVMRLESVEAYERIFAPIGPAIDAAEEAYTIDVSEVTLMNSSGIRALASIVLAAKRASKKLVFVGRTEVPWQRKSVASLRSIYPDLEVRLA
jgi:hypothetical protein